MSWLIGCWELYRLVVDKIIVSKVCRRIRDLSLSAWLQISSRLRGINLVCPSKTFGIRYAISLLGIEKYYTLQTHWILIGTMQQNLTEQRFITVHNFIYQCIQVIDWGRKNVFLRKMFYCVQRVLHLWKWNGLVVNWVQFVNCLGSASLLEIFFWSNVWIVRISISSFKYECLENKTITCREHGVYFKVILGWDKIIVDGRLFLRYMCTQLTNCILGGASAKKYKLTDYDKNFYPLVPVKIRVLPPQQDIIIYALV